MLVKGLGLRPRLSNLGDALAGRLLGSVPANISHRAACDVLIVHTTGKHPKK